MNKAFKVIWSEARNAYVVVSEMAKSHGTKSCSTKKLLAMLIATGIMTCASAAPVMAEDVDNLAPTKTKIVIGKDAEAIGIGCVAIGNEAKAKDGDTVAIGQKASASKQGSIAIGNTATASEEVAIAIGRNAVASGKDSIAIGSKTIADQIYSVAIGNDISVIAKAGTAVGQQAYASGENATAIGYYTNVDSKWPAAHSGQRRNAGKNSTAIGVSAGSWGDNSTAVGSFSKAEGKNATALGSSSKAEGEKATALGSSSKANYIYATAIGGNSQANARGTALGYNSQANVEYGTALGFYSKVTAFQGVAIGDFSVADRASGVVGAFAPEGEDSLTRTWKATGGAVSVGSDKLTRQITNVAAGSEDTDAVNVAQLKRAMENVNINFVAGEGIVIETVKGNDGTTYKISTNIIGSETDTDTTTVTSSASGDVGTIDGDTEIANNNIQTGDPVKIETVTKPTNFAADEGDALAISPSETLGIKGDKNITTKANGKNIQVTLNQDLDVNSVAANTVTTGQTVMDKDGLKVGDNVSVTATAVTAGKTSISDEGVKVGDNTYISDKGLNANGQQITNVADGKVEKDSKDAINGGQLHQAKADINNRIDGVENQVVSNTNRINQLGSRVNKVGAGAAALAALHPMDFDPDDKWSFAAGYGNYAGENAAAIGAYYRPDEKVMFSVGGTVGNGENMVNAGISFALDRTNHVSNSRTALAREVIDLRGQLAEMGAKMAKMEKAFGMLDETKTKLFPDIPANHWAYEYIAKLAGNGYIEGYPDGNFGGDRLMTRYEFAAMLYRAIENGAALEEKIIKEFEPELGRIRVDRISGEDGDRNKIERVRVNAVKGERDHYGNKIAKAEAKAK
ncbi:ESPR-type extended signal peptide-containing protein [Acidaminococcus fermentans]|uniref:ESPR-type extended signal peptide-containing protein n=1 Tax=Acidaminococcus fermentans TaxID=905 RepID=UPI00265F7207|nr:ESPR-type extended signal peptide-containing protein [Acidaminococcus fermentans]